MKIRYLAGSAAAALLAMASAWAQTPQVNCPAGQVCSKVQTKPAAGKNTAAATGAGSGTAASAVTGAAKGPAGVAGIPSANDLRGVTGNAKPGELNIATQNQPKGPAPDAKALAGLKGTPAADPAAAQADALNGLVPGNRDTGKPGSSARNSIDLGGGLPSRGSLVGMGKVESVSTSTTPDGGTRVEVANKSSDGTVESFDTYTIPASGGGTIIYHDRAAPSETIPGQWEHDEAISVNGGQTWIDLNHHYMSGRMQASSGSTPPNRNIDPDSGTDHRGPVTCPPLARNCDTNMLTGVRDKVAAGGGPGARPGDTGEAVPRLNVDTKGAVINPSPVDGTPGGNISTAPQGARMVDGGKLVNPGSDPDH